MGLIDGKSMMVLFSSSNPSWVKTTGIDESDAAALQTKWSQTLTRKGASAGYGAYTVVFNQDGFDEENSTITDFPSINPMQSKTSTQGGQ